MYTPSSASDSSSELDQHGGELPPNPALALSQHPRADELRTTLGESLPYCSGTLDLPTEGLVLFYGKREAAGRLDLSNPTLSALAHLETTCDPATFGVDNRDVLDESYRKARKLDSQCFAFNLDVERAGLLEAVRMALFSGRDERKAIHAELYKLNVYGKDSFFKSHKDTPRGTSMFGSLVLVLPTPHEGGELILQHQGNEWTYNAAQVLSPSSLHASPRIAYVAFFSDVDHEVKRVTSGYRVTITYNLHFSEPVAPLQGLDVIQPRCANNLEVESALNALLNDPTFLPNGGTLGFGLRHLYPLPASFHPHTDDTLASLKLRLKGADSALFRACTARRLRPSLHSVFEWRDPTSDDDGGLRALIAFPRVVQFHTHSHDDDEVLWEKLCRRFDGVLVNARPADLRVGATSSSASASAEEGGIECRDVHWVTALSGVNGVKTRFAAYGNEPEIGCLYQRICLLVDVDSPEERSGVV
ncbi:hypothetical protein LXA43DRAFT_1163304 [Ganoderma leucocontextum]|nr:hypothetical protein LXA43DRAFT_1163304 [Ganoderma leucocontextum]